MKANTIGYLIVPSARTVQRVMLNDYRDIYSWVECSTFDAARMEAGDAWYVDDEGLLKPQPSDNFFTCAGRMEPLCGNGLLLGCDDEGESIPPSIGWEDFKARNMVHQVTVVNVRGIGMAQVLQPVKYLDDILPAPQPRPRGWESV